MVIHFTIKDLLEAQGGGRKKVFDDDKHIKRREKYKNGEYHYYKNKEKPVKEIKEKPVKEKKEKPVKEKKEKPVKDLNMENTFPPFQIPAIPEITEIPETSYERQKRRARENYKNDVKGVRTEKLKKLQEKREKGEIWNPTPQQAKEYRKKRNANAEKKARLKEQKTNYARKKAAEKKAAKMAAEEAALMDEPQQYTEEEIMQDFADAFGEPEPEPQLNELEQLDQELGDLFGSGPIFSRPRRRTPEAVPVPVAVADAIPPQLLQWGQGVLIGILNHLTEEERTSPNLRALVLHHLRDNYPNIEENPHLIQLIMNLLDGMVRGNGRPTSQAYKVQSVLFDKKKFNPQQAMIWLHQNGYKIKKIDETAKMLRFRQLAPATLRKKDYSKFITKKLGNSGIELIIAYPISYA
jgi:hypothetical protein